MEWLDAHNGAIVGAATVVLVVVTGYYAWQTHGQLGAMRESIREGQRTAILPILRPASGEAEQHLYPKYVAELRVRTDQQPPPVQIENAGPGLAGSIQWEVRTSVSVGGQQVDPSVPREHTYFLRLPPGEAAWLWQSARNLPMPVVDNDVLTVWYDDVLGTHYRAVFRRHGTNWVSVEPGTRIEKRPQLFGPSPF